MININIQNAPISKGLLAACFLHYEICDLQMHSACIIEAPLKFISCSCYLDCQLMDIGRALDRPQFYIQRHQDWETLFYFQHVNPAIQKLRKSALSQEISHLDRTTLKLM